MVVSQKVLVLAGILALQLSGLSSGRAEEVSTAATQTPSISIIAWNLEGRRSDADLMCRHLKSFSNDQIFALSEVDPERFEMYRKALGENYQSAAAETGRDLRLQILFDGDRFELLSREELERYRDNVLNDGRHRSPLLVRLRDRETGMVFQVMVNHLARGDAAFRTVQAAGLREWGRDQTLPTFCVGDFNFDFAFDTRRGNDAFPEMLRDNVWTWVEPVELIDTNWADRNEDGIDDYPDSMLDFAFVAGPAKDWNLKCEVIVREGDFPARREESDHRAIRLVATPK